MVTFAELRAAQPAAWMAVAAAYREAAEAVADRADALATLILTLAAAWHGRAADEALIRLSARHLALSAAYPVLIGIDQAITEFAGAMWRARDAADTVTVRPAGSIVRVDASGRVSFDGGTRRPGNGDVEEFAATVVAIGTALASARAADAEVTTRLAAAPAGFDPSGLSAPAYVPPAGTSPAGVSAWWSTLTAGERQYLIIGRPSDVCALDGIPDDARDQAGRILIRQQALALRLFPAGPERERGAGYQGLTALRTRLAATRLPRAWLLGADAADNRAIVSIGNPDRADDVLTIVPGLGSGLAAAGVTLSVLDRVTSAAPIHGPGSGGSGGLATVGWIGYAAPGSLRAAANRAAADAGAGALYRFDNGLRVTHDGAPAHDTLLGFSYGGTVAGVTAATRPLTDDDVVFMGTPGVGAASASALHVPAGHVWASTARYDAIRAAVDPLSAARHPFTGGLPSHQWFGTDPTSDRFGARVFTSDPGSWRHPVRTHESYFDSGSASLRNVVRIATGDYADVS